MIGVLVESARWIGRMVWLEERIFEILGLWVPSVPEPDVKLAFASQSRHHAWHAQLLREHLPETHAVEPGALVEPPSDETVAFAAAFRASATTPERLVGLFEVTLPAVVEAYRARIDAANPITDGPLVRALRFVLVDDDADAEAGVALLASRAPDGAPEHAATLRAAAERARS